MRLRVAARARRVANPRRRHIMAATDSSSSRDAQRFLRWIVVSIPLSWGVYATLQKAIQLFR
jgi:hypothetical protein